MAIYVSLNGADTVVVGAASQGVYGYNGHLTVDASAANAGAFVRTGSGGASLDITTGGTATLNASDSGVEENLLDAGVGAQRDGTAACDLKHVGAGSAVNGRTRGGACDSKSVVAGAPGDGLAIAAQGDVGQTGTKGDDVVVGRADDDDMGYR